jgi:hypothetical protein
MTASSLTSVAGNSCLDEQIERLKRCEYLREGEVKALCLRAREILVDESNVQRVDAPVTVRAMNSGRVLQGIYARIDERPDESSHLVVTRVASETLLNRYVVTSMVNFMILWSCSRSEANVLTRIISFLVRRSLSPCADWLTSRCSLQD